MFCISGNAGLRLRPALPSWFILTCCLATSCTKHYRAEGVILALDRGQKTVTISHRAIPKYMEPMVMPFAVRNGSELKDLTPGARITFNLEVRSGRAQVSGIRLESTGIEDVPVPAGQRKTAVGAPVPDFELRDQRNGPVHLSDFRGRAVVLDFIYTRCPLPDVCPRLSANMARLQKRFGKRLMLLSITIDPEYDTPEVLAGYARRWRADPENWLFLTGSGEQIRDVAANFGLVYWTEEGLITHTAVTAIIDPKGRLQAMLEGSRFTSQQLLDLVSAMLGPASQPQAPPRQSGAAR